MGFLVPMIKKKKKKRRRSNMEASSSKRMRRSKRIISHDPFELEDTRSCKELKDMRELPCNDEAFHLSWEATRDIIHVIRSLRTPTPTEYNKWDEYAISFYLKMCACFGVDYQHLEAAASLKSTALKELQEKQMTPLTEEEESFRQFWRPGKLGFCRLILDGPIGFGSYSPGTTPDRIPYHLYLLVKEAVDVMKRYECHNNPNDLIALTTAEEKILFFCTYFSSHLPTDWDYDRDKASSLIAGYDTTRKPRYSMAGYTPYIFHVRPENDQRTFLTRIAMANIMGIMHSRKMPKFWKMSWKQISFYCKLCSCFGIDYRRLEAATEDDVCLMKV